MTTLADSTPEQRMLVAARFYECLYGEDPSTDQKAFVAGLYYARKIASPPGVGQIAPDWWRDYGPQVQEGETA